MSNPPLQYPREALQEWLKQRKDIDITDDQMLFVGDLVDALFFASLGREEGQPALIRFVYVLGGTKELKNIVEAEREDSSHGPYLTWDVIPFEPIPFTTKTLVKTASAASIERTVVVVGPHHNQLHILGIARRIKGRDGGTIPVFSAPEAGFIILSVAGEELFRYEQGLHILPMRKILLRKVLFEDGIIKTTLQKLCEPLIKSLPAVWPHDNTYTDIAETVFHIIRHMNATRHGGLVVISPDPHLMANPAYPISHGDRALLSQRLRTYIEARKEVVSQIWRQPEANSRSTQDLIDIEEQKATEEMLQSLVENIGRLTIMDNALLIGPNLEVIGAGTPISFTAQTLPDVFEAHDLKGTPGALYDIDRHGSRHRAAALFAYNNQGGLVFISSQDGPLRCMLRPPSQDKVLLWNLRFPEI